MTRSAILFLSVCAVAANAAGQRGTVQTSFEDVPAGAFETLATEIGDWRAPSGHAMIDAAHHRRGSQCLHLRGGDARHVVFEPSRDDIRELTFWAERWTRRAPFEFRVESRSNGAWREVYRGDDAIAIGGFETRVQITFDGPVEALRFLCTSPSGVLIDDLQLGRAAPMQILEVTTHQEVVPCLVGNEQNVVTRIVIDTMGCLAPLALHKVSIHLDGTTDLEDIAAVELLRTDGTRFGERLTPAARLVFDGTAPLDEGENEIRVSFELSPAANIEHSFDADCDQVQVTGDRSVIPTMKSPPGALRGGIALRRAGEDGAAVHRIPAITTTTAGTLIAVYDVRWKGWGDLPGDIDVGMSRSKDGGRSWAPMKIIADMGGDPAFQHDGVGDPAILVDRDKGTIWVAAAWSHGDRAWRGSGPGLTPDETGQLVLVRSDDDGLSWSAPINITSRVKRPEWCYLLQGPGRGICMHDGTLVFAAQFQDTPDNGRLPHATILYSRDQGASWHIGASARPNTTEAQVAELGDGTLMLNMRDNRGGSRAIYTTDDLGRTWTEHPTSRSALVEPVCNAALLRAGPSTLLFVNPAVSAPPRRRMTIKLSPDLGATWPPSRQLLLDEGQSAGYPSATMIDEDVVGVLFEGSAAQLTFMRIDIADIVR